MFHDLIQANALDILSLKFTNVQGIHKGANIKKDVSYLSTSLRPERHSWR